MQLQGIFPPITTPFDAGGNLYKSKVKHNIGKWNLTGLAGYVVCGSSGESVYLTTGEKMQLWEWVAECAAPDKLLIAGTGMESVRETVELTARAASLGYKAAMVRTPHYYKNLLTRAETQALYFRAVADRSPIPIMIYNWPQTTGVDIPADTVAALSEHPNIIAFKESSGNLDKVREMVGTVKPGFCVLVGSAPTLAPSLAAGASGAVLAFANAAPYPTLAIWEAVRARQMDAATGWQERITPLAALVTTIHGVPGLKYAMDLAGFYGGPPRLPLAPPPPAARLEIEKAFKLLMGS